MSEEDKSQKTEDPTEKRLAEARKKGQVAKSSEVSAWFMISASTLVVAVFVDRIVAGVASEIYPFIESPHAMIIDAEHVFGQPWKSIEGVRIS